MYYLKGGVYHEKVGGMSTAKNSLKLSPPPQYDVGAYQVKGVQLLLATRQDLEEL